MSPFNIHLAILVIRLRHIHKKTTTTKFYRLDLWICVPIGWEIFFACMSSITGKLPLMLNMSPKYVNCKKNNWGCMFLISFYKYWQNHKKLENIPTNCCNAAYFGILLTHIKIFTDQQSITKNYNPHYKIHGFPLWEDLQDTVKIWLSQRWQKGPELVYNNGSEPMQKLLGANFFFN